MSTDQRSGLRITRLMMTAVSAAFITALSLCFITFKSNTPSPGKVSAKHPSVNSEQACITVPEHPEMMTNMLPVISVEAKKPEHEAVAFLVNPPLPEILPESVVETIDPGVGGSATCKSGSLAYFPPNAFVDVNGKPIKDPVKVVFTEYRDYKDIFISGIPMIYQQGSKQGQMESAGMMQLEASANNQPVYVNKDAQIKIMLASNVTSADYNLYYFDKKKGEWKEKGKDQVVYKKKELKKSVAARIMAAFKPKERAVFLASFEGVPEDKVFLWWRTPANDFDFSFIRIFKSFPELKFLSGMQWEYRGTDAKEVYAQMFNVPVKDKNHAARRGFWKSYTAEMHPENTTATITLFYEDESMSFDVRPKDRSEKNLLKVKNRMEKYNAALEGRIKDDQVDYANYQKDSTAYSYPLEASTTIKMDVMRSFEIDNVGVWNVDRIIKDNNFVTYNLQLVDEDNNPIVADEVFLVDKNYNSVFRFYGPSLNKMRINAYSNNMLFVVLPGNKLAYAGQQEIWKLAGKKGKQKVTMKVKDDAVASIEQAREQLNF